MTSSSRGIAGDFTYYQVDGLRFGGGEAVEAKE
jgi:hypothetical protein